MRKRNEFKLAALIPKELCLSKKIHTYNSIHCALEFIHFKEARSIKCVLLNVFTQEKVREWSAASGPPLSLPYPLTLTGQLSKFLSQRLFKLTPFSNALHPESEFLEISFFWLSYHFFLSIKQIVQANLCAWPDYFRVFLRKKKQ